jgi:hypothetical protein
VHINKKNSKPCTYTDSKKPIISIVIPCLLHDTLFTELLYDLAHLDANYEIILVLPAGTPMPSLVSFFSTSPLSEDRLRVLFCKKGRAIQLNHGAFFARSDILWFLHGDTRLKRDSLNMVIARIRTGLERALWYLKLSFNSEGPRLVRLNSTLANIRSLCGIPFGDQGFLIEKKLFMTLEGFPEDVTWGEDHAFIWRCHVMGIKVRRVPAYITTSARAYAQHGWLRTTLRYVFATVQQIVRFRRNAITWAKQKGLLQAASTSQGKSS